MRLTPKIISLVLLLTSTSVHAQEEIQKVLTEGKIVYLRKVYLQKNLEDMGMANKEWYSRMRDKIPKVIETHFDLVFNPTTSSFYPSTDIETQEQRIPSWLQSYTSTNEVYLNLENHELILQKSSMGKDFLIEDSLPILEWKITDDFMTIAGYACRKATSIVMDSLYIMAFYTDALYPSTGPEHFYGLPGTILGISVPRLHTSYMATEVVSTTVTQEDLKKPKRGKKTTLTELQNDLYNIGESWRKNGGDRMSWMIWL